MRNLRKLRSVLFVCFLFIIAGNVNATAVSTAGSFIDFQSVSISSDPSIGSSIGTAELESYVSVSNDDGFRDSNQIGGIGLNDDLFGFNVDAFAGNDGDDFLGVFTDTDSVFGDVDIATASSFLSVLIPFTLDFTSSIGISFDYELFSSAETDEAGEYSLATTGLEYSLLDEGFRLLDALDIDLLVEEFDGGFNDDFVEGTFNSDYAGLSAGEYYVAIDLFSDSFTEAFLPVNADPNAIPAPGTLMLMLIGIAFVGRKSLKQFGKKKIAIAA